MGFEDFLLFNIIEEEKNNNKNDKNNKNDDFIDLYGNDKNKDFEI